MGDTRLSILHIPVQWFIDWIYGHGPAPSPELASWPSPLPTTSPLRLDGVSAPSTCTWGDPTNETDPAPCPNGLLLTRDIRRSYQTALITELTPSHTSHTSSLEDFAITLVRPRPPQGTAIVVLPRIETHVYLGIALPSRSWNAIRLPLTKSVKSDDSSGIGESIKPLLLVITIRGATTQHEYHYVCGKCEARMGNKMGPPSLIDFHSPSNILTAKHGMIRVHFTFSCYSRHHRKEDEQFVVEVILKDTSNPSEPRVVSRKALPYSFDVRSSIRRSKPTSALHPTSVAGRRTNGHISTIGESE